MTTKEPPEDEPYCSECNEPNDGENMDFGIGSYEFWGQRGCDTNIQFVSTCCEAVLKCNGVEVEYEPPFEEPDNWEEWRCR